MKQAIYGLILFVILILPPVATILESVMIIHMHMQMPLFIVAGFLMAKYFMIHFPSFFERWNNNGIPGILLFMVIMGYWMLPRAMDDALTTPMIEWFKFISLTFLAGVPLRDSWGRLQLLGRNIVIFIFAVLFTIMGWLYIAVDQQLCNNYLRIEQITLGWGFVTMALCMFVYLVQLFFVDKSEYE